MLQSVAICHSYAGPQEKQAGDSNLDVGIAKYFV